MAYEAVIGLECHIQLNTRSKMFCDCPAAFGAEANTNVCPVCLGLPGALPRANRAAIDSALRLGIDRGEITQYDRPLCEGGALPVGSGGRQRSFELIRIHVEEDTGKSFHPERFGDRPVSRVDFNRAGVPLLELVTQPVFRETAECSAFLTGLRRLVRWLAISDGDMEKGHMRCDANVSIRPAGTTQLGTKTELKNLNSIRGVEKGLAAEIARQKRALEAGETIEQATLLYDADHDKLAVMRSKEYAHDYRYFPEPDLPLLRVSAVWIAQARESLPELPWEAERRLETEFALSGEVASIVGTDREYVRLMEDLARAGVQPRTAANWVANVVIAHINRLGIDVGGFRERVPLAPFATLLTRIESGQVTATAAKSLLEEVLDQGADPFTRFTSGGQAVSGDDVLLPLVRAVIAENQGPVEQYRNGKTATLGFLVGQVMKKSGSQAVAQTVRELLVRELSEPAAT
ncbi:MAG: Asp-tRNA(Asn)/Glu-tRNA(Gln) amidotransferase subunit GatB [Candidatus Eisenbacteria bacterium]|uniref:Aspartyl/glutamyl-tRNA(Asn/Gln) amidotransferase subunit B n=1 Tax=Eiseniibacteriota bacterium TaxID=2212470 RepID=A0A538T4C5_UNCEI|nr:MAG: Asp-tRNA(Asn)/Glu-tRNA(Gln) amidotransferase subunit GatB [Candidatus Eisenbacteria bacterium]